MRPIIICGVYLIISPTGRKYVGSSNDIYKRWRQYRRLVDGRQGLLKRSFDKYGIDSHRFKIVLVCEPQKRLKAERLLGDFYSSMAVKGGLNLQLPGYDDVPLVMSEAVKKKLSDANIGKRHSAETIKKLSDINIGSKKPGWVGRKISAANKGRKHTKEHNEKVGLAQRGKIVSAETRGKISVAKMGTITSAETKVKLSIASKGVPKSADMRKKLSLSKMGCNPSPISTQKLIERQSKKVINMETGEIFNSGKDAADFYGINKCTLSTWLRGAYPNKSNLKYLVA